MVYNPVYKIVKGGQGGFLCPPGHPHHTMHLEGFESPRHRKEMMSGSIEYALSDSFDGSSVVTDRVRKIMAEATLVESEMWIKHVYGYFHSTYAPEDGSRNVSDAVHHNPAEIAAKATGMALADYFSVLPLDVGAGEGVHNAESYRDGSRKPMRAARRGWEATATPDGSQVFVYALADDGTRYGSLPLLERYADALTANGFAGVIIEDASGVGDRVRATNPVPIEPIDPARHLAVLMVRKYFPDHVARLDLIDNPGTAYGSRPCTKCGERVQYEAKFDKLAKITTRVDGTGMTHWTYGTECPSGGDHTTD